MEQTTTGTAITITKGNNNNNNNNNNSNNNYAKNSLKGGKATHAKEKSKEKQNSTLPVVFPADSRERSLLRLRSLQPAIAETKSRILNIKDDHVKEQEQQSAIVLLLLATYEELLQHFIHMLDYDKDLANQPIPLKQQQIHINKFGRQLVLSHNGTTTLLVDPKQTQSNKELVLRLWRLCCTKCGEALVDVLLLPTSINLYLHMTNALKQFPALPETEVISSKSYLASTISEPLERILQTILTLPLDDEKTFYQTTTLLEFICDVEEAQKVLSRYTLDILAFFSKLIVYHSRPFCTGAGTDNNNNINVEHSLLEWTLHCDHICKALLVIQNKQYQVIRNHFTTLVDIFLSPAEQKSSSLGQCKEYTVFKTLLSSLLRLLSSPLCPKESACSAALAVCNIIKLLLPVESTEDRRNFNTELVIRELLLDFFLDYPVTVPGTLTKQLDQLSVLDHLLAPEWKMSGDTFRKIPTLARLFLVRSVLITIPSSILLLPIQLDGRTSTILFGLQFPATFRLCEETVSADRFLRLSSTLLLQEHLQSVLDSLKVKEGVWVASIGKEISASFLDSVLEFVWKNWEDRFDAIGLRSKQIFQIVLDILEGLKEGEHKEMHSKFLKELTTRLMNLEWHRKAKYNTLELLLSKIGPHNLLAGDNFLLKLFNAMSDQTVCNSAAQFLETFLTSIKSSAATSTKETNSSTADAQNNYSIWAPALVQSLLSPSSLSTFNRGVAVYGIPTILKLFPAALKPLLVSIVSNKMSDVVGKSVVAVLKTGRKMRLIAGTELENVMQDAPISLSALLEYCLSHEDEDLSLDALELVSVSGKELETPTNFECRMVQLFLLHNTRTIRSSFRMNSVTILKRFLLRMKECSRKLAKPTKGNSSVTTASPIDAWNDYIGWIASTLMASIYPGASFPRKQLALQLYRAVVEVVWGDDGSSGKQQQPPQQQEFTHQPPTPPSPLFVQWEEAHMQAVLHSLWDTWDLSRQEASGLLSSMPLSHLFFPPTSPVVHMSVSTSTANSSKKEARSMKLDEWFAYWTRIMALALSTSSTSPRVRECEIGAMLFGWCLAKCVKPFRWVPSVSYDAPSQQWKVIENNHTIVHNEEEAIQGIYTIMLSTLTSQVEQAAIDLEKASTRGPMHGILLSLRYLIGWTDFKRLAANSSKDTVARWRQTISTLIEGMQKVIQVTLKVVADLAPEGYSSQGVTTMATGQPICVASWLCVKEVALLAGVLVSNIPLPETNTATEGESSLLTVDQVKSLGELLVSLLLSTRHKGAIEKTYVGFQCICEVLFKSSLDALFQLPGRWMEQLLTAIANSNRGGAGEGEAEPTTAEALGLVTRRSAGLPYCINAMLRGEIARSSSSSAAKSSVILLPRTMERLFKMASTQDTEQRTGQQQQYQSQIHSINVLRSIFMDKDLAVEVEKWTFDLFVVVVEGFKSPSWAVRNSATMAFSILLDRSVRAKKVRDERSVLNGTTFKEFFGKFPSLHPFLLEHLQDSLHEHQRRMHQPPEENPSEQQSVLESTVYVVLLVLSRLVPSIWTDSSSVVHLLRQTSNISRTKPSSISTPIITALSPAPFASLVVQCATSLNNFLVRQMAALAFVPLVSSTELPDAISFLLDALPDVGDQVVHNRVHGILLLIQSLLKGHLHTPSIPPSVKQEILEDIIPNKFSKKQWIVRATPCSALSCLFLDITREFVLQETSETIMGTFLPSLQFARSTLATPSYNSLPTTIDVMQTSALQSSASLLCHQRTEDSTITLLLNHPDYQVRKMVLKFIDKQLQQRVKQSVSLQKQLTDRIHLERYHSCLKRLLSLIRLLQIPIFPTSQPDLLAIQQIWQLIGRIKKSIPAATNSVIEFTGYFWSLLYQLSITSLSTVLTKEMCSEWIEVLKDSWTSGQAQQTRKAIATALCYALRDQGAGQTEQGTLGEEVLVNSWITCIWLLQDEDEEIRLTISSLVSSELQQQDQQRINQLQIGTALWKPGPAQAQVFQWLSRRHNSSQTYYDFLFNVCCTDPAELVFCEEAPKEERKLFEKEEENDYAEPLVLVQLASFHLRRQLVKRRELSLKNNENNAREGIMIEDDAITLSEQMANELIKGLKWIKDYCKDYNPQTFDLTNDTLWSVQITFKPDVFLTLYRLTATLISCCCTLPQPKKESSLLSLVQEISTLVSQLPVVLHPLLRSLLEFLFQIFGSDHHHPDVLEQKYYYLLFGGGGGGTLPEVK